MRNRDGHRKLSNSPRFIAVSQWHLKHRKGGIIFLGLFLLLGMPLLIDMSSTRAQDMTATGQAKRAQVQTVKFTVLSTNLASFPQGIGEWGFAGLLESEGHRVLVDTGSHPDTVLQNARDLKIDLSDVREVVLTHCHGDHVRGLMTLRRTLMKTNVGALSVVHVARGIFYSRPRANGEGNEMIAIKKDYEATGGKFIELDKGAEIFPGAWLTGPVPRVYPERNWSGTEQVLTPAGSVEDTVPEDQSLVLNTRQGLVVVTGCAHAGIINILTFCRAQFPGQPIEAVIGGMHLFADSDEQLDWTSDKLKEFKVTNLVGEHCTGIEALHRLRDRLGLTRKTAGIVGVGGNYVLGEGLRPGPLAR
jgi:7,8-dihydropterin-6-yl-methyl-4-(beta-D-ribofuranosyl)aminobenzene 5'-phosphate synthase